MSSPAARPAQGEAPHPPKLGWPTIAVFAAGNAATDIKSRGIAMFMMVFYNQVMGLPAGLVGLAASIALVVDAIIDPVVGQTSDNLKTPWGRRHPLMYASALPVSVAFVLLWTAPAGLGDWELFGYLLACLITIRICDTLFELPSQSLIPELTSDYLKRTNIFALRSFFGMGAGLLMTILVYQAIMPEKDGIQGILTRDGYLTYGLVAGTVIFCAIVISAVSTHKFIPWLRRPPARRPSALMQIVEMTRTLKNHNFLMLAVFSCFAALSSACKIQLDMYFNLFFWEFDQLQLSGLITAALFGSAAAAGIAPVVGRHLSKKTACLVAYISAFLLGIAPIVLRLAGWMPENGSPLLYGIIVAETFLYAACAAQVAMFLGSMMADVSDDAEVKTGRRSEGLLFAADGFFKKLTSSGGPIVAGVLLGLVAFPANAAKEGVAPDVLVNLALAYVVITTTLYSAAVPFLMRFRISRAQHAQNISVLAARLRD